MKKRLFLILVIVFAYQPDIMASKMSAKKLTKSQLVNKIKNGWAGQTISTTYSWTPEFMFAGTFIQDYIILPWQDDYIHVSMASFPGLYDDIYMDLMFVDVLEKKGLNARGKDYGEAFAKTEFQLFHANQAGRYNVQDGIAPELAGYWLNNPQGEDIDSQIEADFAGLMSSGIPRVATQISNKVGWLINLGDGLFGSVFVANMYSNAFISNDIKYVIEQSLLAIPKESEFYQVIKDVISWHKKYPKDLKQTCFQIQYKWAEEGGCPSMVFNPLNIDAKINAAYVVMGLLYGKGDYTKTAEISTPRGQDSDCNTATALGLLGTMMGYDRIPEYWKIPLVKAENKKSSHTNYALYDVYEVNYKHALENLTENGAMVQEENIILPRYETERVPCEKKFKVHYPRERVRLQRTVR